MAFSTEYPQADFHFQQADQYEEAGDLDNALIECNKALEIDPCFSDALNLHGIILERMGYDREAIRSYQKAIQFDPDFVEAVDNLSTLKASIQNNRNQDKYDPVRHGLITIATFTHPTEAHVHRAKLESEGIPAFVADENVVTMNWFYSTAIGGVKLQVAEPNAERAQQILNDIDRFNGDRDALPEDQPQCPRCRAFSGSYETFDPRAAFIPQVLTIWISGSSAGVPIPFLSKKWRCNECGYRFKLGEPLWDVDSKEVIDFNRKHARLKKWVKRQVRHNHDHNLQTDHFYYCLKCGSHVDEKWDTCEYCGDSLEETNVDEDSYDFICPKCNKPVSDKWEMCPHCREQLIEFLGYSCSNCGKDVQDGWKVCPDCGESLEEAE